MNRTSFFLAPIVVLSLASSALAAEPMKGHHVRVDNKGKKAIGIVVDENDENIIVGFGASSKSSYKRAEGNYEDLEPLLAESKKKCDAAKTADERYQVGASLQREGFSREDVRWAYAGAIALEPDHALAHEALGEVKLGPGKWVDRRQADRVLKLQKAEEASDDRPWDQYRIVVRKPDKKPDYEIITNCPQELAEQYANFMVDLKKGLIDLIQNKVHVTIKWNKNDCKKCGGKGGSCAHCGGSGEEPCKVFLTNNHKLFMDVTGRASNIGGFFSPGYFEQGECERPIVAFNGTFGVGDNTYGVLAHEGTHQLQAMMWKGSAEELFTRPGFLTEGLAVTFGDGLDIDKVRAGKFIIDVPQDRLAGLRRDLQFGGRYRLKDFLGFNIGPFQLDPSLYAYGWSIIYYMLNCPEPFEFKGQKIKLQDAFAKYFMANCEKGALVENPGNPAHVMTQAMGIAEKDADEALNELEKKWRKYILELSLKQSVEADSNDKKRMFSREGKFEFFLPSKPKHEWTLVKPEDQVRYFGEVCALSAEEGAARIYFCMGDNAESHDLDTIYDSSKDILTNPNGWFRFTGKLKVCDKSKGGCGGVVPLAGTGAKACERCGGTLEEPPDDGMLRGTATEYLACDFEGTERHTFMVPKPRAKKSADDPKKQPKPPKVKPKPKDGGEDDPGADPAPPFPIPNMEKLDLIPQKGRLMVTRTGTTIYKVVIVCDADRWDDFGPELREMLDSFSLTDG